MHPRGSAGEREAVRLLAELAGLYGVLPSYRAVDGREVCPPLESIWAVLRSLGAGLPELAGPQPETQFMKGAKLSGMLERAVRERRARLWRRVAEPVTVAWEGVLPPLTLRLPAEAADGVRGVRLTLFLEDGTVVERTLNREDLSSGGGGQAGSRRYKTWTVTPHRGGKWRGRLPLGYHRLLVEAAGLAEASTVISAPRRCWAPPGPAASGAGSPIPVETAVSGPWGLFAPLYALRSDRDWGAGDLADLEALAEKTARCGGSAVATLPLLAAFLDHRPLDPTPYRPVSRLFWNEFYLPPERLPEWGQCRAARDIWASAGDRLRELRAADLVDYEGVMAVKGPVLEELARYFFAEGDAARREAFSAWLSSCPEAQEYARFRVIAGPGTSERYHLYCQWQMEERLAAVARPSAGAAGEAARAGLFLDFPVGVHPRGFDPWRRPELFASGVSAGAPPDDFFSRGQHWDSPPLHPENTRLDGHRHLAACLRRHMRHADYLRIDHVMGLHRLFWIPEGAAATGGVYVSYPAEEMYAVVSLESHRNRTVVAGEDLGTVPPEVRPAMRRHGVLRTWVAQASLRPRAAEPVGEVPPGVVAAVNTHDMFPLAGFLAGEDITARLATGQVDEEAARREGAARRHLVSRLQKWAGSVSPAEAVTMPGGLWAAPGAVSETPRSAAAPAAAVLRALLSRLVRSKARLTLVNVEDLLLETRPQNVPGTGPERSNWRRKMARPLP